MFKKVKDWLSRFVAVDNTVNENTVIGLSLVIAALIEGFTKRDPVILSEFLLGGLACFGISVSKK